MQVVGKRHLCAGSVGVLAQKCDVLSLTDYSESESLESSKDSSLWRIDWKTCHSTATSVSVRNASRTSESSRTPFPKVSR
jgi:hypothetical protein